MFEDSIIKGMPKWILAVLIGAAASVRQKQQPYRRSGPKPDARRAELPVHVPKSVQKNINYLGKHRLIPELNVA